MKKTVFIVNPRSGGGRTERVWRETEKSLANRIPPFSVKFTKKSGEAAELTRQSLHEGASMVVGVGGDGTANEVVNGFLMEGKPQDATLALLPLGTGCDLARTLRLPRHREGILAMLTNSKTRMLDAGRIEFFKDGPASRYFINVGGFGASGEVVRRVNLSGKLLGPFLTFFKATVETLLIYRGKEVEVKVDNKEVFAGRINTLFAANGRYCGAGMLVGPEAEMDDGLFDIVIVRDLGVMESLLNARKLYTGEVASHPKVTALRGKRIEAFTKEEVLLECDGEQPGSLPATFTIMPSAVHMIVP